MNAPAPSPTLSPPDAELLRAFLDNPQSPAFPQLVARYLPQVYAHARRRLRDPHRAEDAAQTVFLLLAQNARALAPQRSLAGWLHKATHFTCANMQRMEARRKWHEREIARMQNITAPSPENADLESILDGALQQLPARDRELLLLRFVHEYPLAEIAKIVGTSEEAAKKRLQRAIAALRRRFAHHGILSSAALTPIAILAPIAPPPHLAATAAASALKPGATLLAIANGATAMMLNAKLKLLAIAAALLLPVTATLLLARPAAHPPMRPIAAPIAAPPAPPAPAPAAQTSPAPQEETTPDPILVRGIVLDPAGKPLPNALVTLPSLSDWVHRFVTHIVAKTTSGPDGSFQFSFRKADIAQFSDGIGSSMADAWKHAVIFASADNLGLAWSPWNRTDSTGNVRLQLTPDDVPIRGQLLTADGSPAANIPVHIESLIDGDEQKLDAAYAQDPTAAEALMCACPLQATAHADALLTDATGHFEIHGLGRDRLAFLHISGPTLPFARLEVMTRTMAPQTRQVPQPSRNIDIFTTYGATFSYTAPPALSVEGTIRDAATGQPVPGALLQPLWLAGPFQGIDPRGLVTATSDANGHYRLDGLPRGAGNRIEVVPPATQPFFLRTFTLDNTQQPTLTLNVDLHRGLFITGKVTDKVTGQPLPARIHYTTYQDNPHAADLPEFTLLSHGSSHHDSDELLSSTEPDGSYRIVALRGKAIIGVQNYSDHYLKGLGADKIPALTSRRPVLYDPAPPANLCNAVTELDIPDNAPAATADFQLDPGATATIHIVDEHNQPVTNCLVCGADGASYYGWTPKKMSNATFTASALAPNDTRTLLILNTDRHLGKVEPFRLSELQNNTLTVHLAPLATVTGRLLDPTTGKPLPDVQLMLEVGQYLPLATTDAAGKFTIPIPAGGEIFINVFAGPYAGETVAKDLFVDPGETQDLGDIRIRPARRR